MTTRISLVCLLLLVGVALPAQRTYTNINSAWQFSRTSMEEAVEFEAVDIPHTYNSEDAFDDDPLYYRGKATYRKVLITDSLSQSRKHYLRFGAVNQHARVYVNSVVAGEHFGGYTAFTLDISDLLTYSLDTITVEVDNSHDPDVVPLKGDFTFYGGIYRHVQLISVPAAHFSMDHFGSNGVYVKPLKVTDDHCQLRLSGYTRNTTDRSKVVLSIRNKDGVLIDSAETSSFEESSGYWQTHVEFDNPILWSVDSPYLYSVEFNLKQGDQITDHLTVPYGVRYFTFDADEGFFLNGEPIKLIGVNRHQDRQGIGNALSKSDHKKDMKLISDMGVNFLRTAHYPQDPHILNMCDTLGIAVTMEIPLDHEITYSDAFADNAKTMMLEMIFQYYNHPSIFVWAYMNEMGLGKQLKRDSLHMTKVAKLARELEDVTRSADPHRYTMIPNHGYFDIYHEFGLTEIPMIVGWNLYYGWYEEGFEGFGEFVDHAHSMLPDKPFIITEYGAGADPRITSFEPLRFDFSLDWTLKFHQANLKQILERPFIAGSAVWNMFDFGSEARQDAVPHVNSKGLYSYKRKPKPVASLYRAYLSDKPVCEVEDIPRTILLTDYGLKLIPVSIITNQEELKLTFDGIPHKFKTENYIAESQFEIHTGVNEIEVCGKKIETTGYDHESFWSENDTLSINFGSNFYFQQDSTSTTWIPHRDVPSTFVRIAGGKEFVPRDRGIGTDKGIVLTDNDPVYQTMLLGIEELQVLIPDGEYELLFHFARLDRERYNCQQVYINEQIIPVCNIEPYVAWHRSTEVKVSGTLQIKFISGDSETFINGLQIIRK